MKKSITYLVAAVLTVGCGEIKDTLQDMKEQGAAQELKRDIADQGRFALEANEFINLGDDADAVTGEDEAAGGPEAAMGAPSVSGIIAAAEMPGNAVVTDYVCPLAPCLPKTLVSDSEKIGKQGMGSVHAELTFNYFDTVTAAQAGGAGNKNDTPRIQAGNLFVRADVAITGTVPLRDSTEVATITTTGYRVWAINRALWYVVDTSLDTTGFPARPNGKPGVTSVHFARHFAVPDVQALQGTSEKVLTFSDNTTQSTVRHFTFVAATRHMTGTWTHNGRKGFVGLGTFDINIGTTPFCRLDDTGTISIDRTFGESSTNVTSEHIDMTQDGVVLTVAGTLTLADGTTQTKSFTRTQTAPTACGDRGEGNRSFTITGTGYGGNDITFTESRSQGRVAIHAERIMAENGNVQTLDAVRTQGVLEIRATVSDASGVEIFSAHLVLHAGGNGEGQITRLIDGKKVMTNFHIEDGKIMLEKPNGPPEQVD